MGDTTPRGTNSTSSKAHDSKELETQSLRGTLVSVMILGTLLVLSWIGVFYLFLNRA